MGKDGYDLVVVANRLPVDCHGRRRRDRQLAALPRRPGHGARARDAERRRRLGRLGRRPRPRARPLRRRRHAAGPGDAERGRGRALLRGLLQRHPLAALPRRHRAPAFHRQWWDAYRTVNQRFAEAAAEQAADGADRLGARLPAPARPGHAARRCARTCGSASSTTSRSPRSRSSQQLPWRRQVIDGLLGADLIGFQRAGDAANFVARRAPPDRPHHARPDRSRPGRRRAPRPARARGAVPDLDRLRAASTSWPARPRCRPAPRRSGTTSATRRSLHARRRPPRLHQGHPAPHQGVRRAARRRPPRRRARRTLVQVASPSRENVGAYQELREHVEVLVGRINGEYGELGHTADPLPAPLLPAGGDGGAVPRGRRHARHLAARRHEPRRQGVRRGPLRRRAACSCCREFTGAADELAGPAAGQPARHRRHEGHHRARRRRWTPRSSASACAACAARSSTDDVAKWSSRFLDDPRDPAGRRPDPAPTTPEATRPQRRTDGTSRPTTEATTTLEQDLATALATCVAQRRRHPCWSRATSTGCSRRCVDDP